MLNKKVPLLELIPQNAVEDVTISLFELSIAISNKDILANKKRKIKI